MSDEPRYGLTDDITLCPRCQSRTDFEETGGPDGEQRHTCLNPACQHVFVGFFDPEDFDAEGNFIDTEEVSDFSDIDTPTVSAWPRDWSENPGKASDFTHLDRGMTVTVINRETTWEPGDDSQTEVVLEPGTDANVIDWVEEWFHVHVRTHEGQHAWVCPDNLKEKK